VFDHRCENDECRNGEKNIPSSPLKVPGYMPKFEIPLCKTVLFNKKDNHTKATNNEDGIIANFTLFFSKSFKLPLSI
jgi:hypothetical protein